MNTYSVRYTKTDRDGEVIRCARTCYDLAEARRFVVRLGYPWQIVALNGRGVRIIERSWEAPSR
jgi:hypothetical protein